MIYKQKLELKLDIKQVIELPIDSQIVYVGNQNDEICFWYIFNPDIDTKQKFEFIVLGTGMESEHIDHQHVHIGTVLMGSFVWHVFVKQDVLWA
jgi:hypothetical protein